MTIQVFKTDSGWGVYQDDQLIKTPRQRPWIVPTEELAAAIAVEWCQQDPAKINWREMPLGQLAQTALDIVPDERATIIAGLMRYVDTETLCQRAPHPRELAEQQEQLWNPILDWFMEAHHAAWQIASGVMPVTQSAALKQCVERVLRGMDDFRLAGLRHAAQSSGSVVLALALQAGGITAEACYEAAEVESRYQVERWGSDDEMKARLSSLWRETELCQNWFRLLSPEA